MKVRTRFWPLAAVLFWPLPAVAQEVAAADDRPPVRDDIVVYGRALAQIGTATSGSQGTVGYEDFADRPLSRVGELAENGRG